MTADDVSNQAIITHSLVASIMLRFFFLSLLNIIIYTSQNP